MKKQRGKAIKKEVDNLLKNDHHRMVWKKVN
jgi:hypothetical protein